MEEEGWAVYDVEEVVLDLVEDIPQEKIRLRIGTKIKKWVKGVEDRIVLVNSNILYSKEMGKIGPFSAFKYQMRGDRQGILFLDAKLRGNTAVYSIPGREDHQERELSDVIYVSLDEVKNPEG